MRAALLLQYADRPGIYRMLRTSGDVLYVGKAASLHKRVNSYFRGQKNRDRFKLEMLAQVWDLRVSECNSALEAALLENDEIKRYDPPYNVVLKRGREDRLWPLVPCSSRRPRPRQHSFLPHRRKAYHRR